MVEKKDNYYVLSCDSCGKDSGFKFNFDFEAAIVAKYLSHFYNGSEPVLGNPFVCPICAAKEYFKTKGEKHDDI